MKTRHLLRYAPLLLACSAALTANATVCDPRLIATLQRCQRLVGSLRYEKLGESRVFAPDGSVFSAGQAQWMKGQLLLIQKECAHGDTANAAQRLTDVQQLIQQHRYSGS